MAERIAVAMSGGVDSSAAAWLMREQGYELMGITLTLFDDINANVPGNAQDVADAAHVAGQLGFPHHVLNMAEQFRSCVMDHFAASYEAGRTPNPCVVCNRCIKFGALLERALELGAHSVATGHYAQIEYDTASSRWLLKKAVHPEKDQSYVLCTLSQEQLAAARFPLGGLSKGEIRQIALEQGLVSARKRESQDICFIPDGDYASFIRRHTGREYPSGAFINENGQVLGQHTGIIGYTVGQRRGLGVSSNQGRLYVKELRVADNTVVLCDNQSLFSRSLTAGQLNWIAVPKLDGPMRLKAKVRYRQQEQPCVVEQTGEDSIHVIFDQPQRAITPGQMVVFYDGDVVVGGAVIAEGKD